MHVPLTIVFCLTTIVYPITHLLADETTKLSQEMLLDFFDTTVPVLEAIKLKYWPENALPDYIVPVPSIIFDPLKGLASSFKKMIQTIDKDAVDEFKLLCQIHEPITKFKLFSYLLVFRDWLKHDVYVNDTIIFEDYLEFKPEAKEFLEDLYSFYNKGTKIWLMMYGLCESLGNRPSNDKAVRFYLKNVRPFVDDMLYVIHDMKVAEERMHANNSTLTTTSSPS